MTSRIAEQDSLEGLIARLRGYMPLKFDNGEAFTPPICSEAANTLSQMRAALEPFAAMGRVMEIRATVTFGKMPPDSEIVCESSGEAGIGILTMGHFRDAAALLPKAPGWGGVYIRPFDRAALTTPKIEKE